MTVGRDRPHHRHALHLRGVQIDPVQVIAGLLHRNGEAGVVNQALQRLRLQQEAAGEFAMAGYGKVFARQGCQGKA